MNVRKMTDLEIYELGIELLIDKLGPAGMMRFFRKLKSKTLPLVTSISNSRNKR